MKLKFSFIFHSYSATSCKYDNVKVEEKSVMCHASAAKTSVYFYFIFYIQIFFLVNFRYVAKVFYLKIEKSIYSASC